MDEHYPSEETLDAIRVWDFSDLTGLFARLKSEWWMPNWGWREAEGDNGCLQFRISTGGWSGNEELIYALQDNAMAWGLTWQQSKRGGHYEFEIPANFRTANSEH